MENINKIEEAKKYLGKIIYTGSDFDSRGKYKLLKLYVGGIHLFYNQVNYEVISFEVYENKSYTKGWGNVELARIVTDFEKRDWNNYFFSELEAKKYVDWQNKTEVEQEKENDINHAKELLEKHKIKFNMFD